MRCGVIFFFLGLVLLAGSGWIFESLLARLVAAYSAMGFLVVSFGYFLRLPAVWLKRGDGTINPLGYLLCLPLHLLNWISLHLAARCQKYPALQEIAPNLWLGRRPFESEAKALVAADEWAVVDLTSEFQEPLALRSGKYLCLPTLDHTAPLRSQLKSALDFIAAEKSLRKVLVHCALGHGRSATIVAAWLIQNGMAKTASEADGQLRRIRPGVRLKKTQRRLLEEYFPENL